MAKPMMAWNPVQPTLAIRASDGVAYLFETTPSGSTQILIEGGAPTDMAWSPDGSMLALTAGASVYTATTAGDTTLVLQRSGDTFADLAWSPNGSWLLYRVTRDISAWFEAVDVFQTTLSAPIPITAAEPISSAGGALSLSGYRLLMPMKPAWATGGLLYYPTFATGAPTVGILSVDVSGLSP
jgi:hypothetical protein